MSDITVSRPEMLNGHTDVICSTSIRHVVTVRNEVDLPLYFQTSVIT